MMFVLPGEHWSSQCTSSSEPAAAALATLDVIREENLLVNCREMGTRMLDAFYEMKTKYPFVGDARGLGLMLAMEMIVPNEEKRPNSEAVTSVLNNCLERGLVAYMAGTQSQVLRLIPPLNVTTEQADEALRILDDSLAAYWQEVR